MTSNESSGAVSSAPRLDEFRGNGVVVRQSARVWVLLGGILDSATCTSKPISGEVGAQTASAARVVQYDGVDSLPRVRHYTEVGKTTGYRACNWVEVETSARMCEWIGEGRYVVLWDADGRVVLVAKSDIDSNGDLLARGAPGEQRPVATPPFRLSRELVTRRVRLDLSLKCLGRAGEARTERFVGHLMVQLAEKDHPLAFEFREGAPARPFGHTVYQSARVEDDGRVTVGVEAPAEILDRLEDGTWCLTAEEYWACVDGRHQVGEGGLPLRIVTVPQLKGFALTEGPVGSSLDTSAARIILDSPG